MSAASESEALLVSRIRDGDEGAWRDLIAQFEGRLLAFAKSRIGRRAASEDVVQEALLGFLTSLPHYDASRSLESYLFSITAHKLTDHLRREGRRPTLPLARGESGSEWEPAARDRAVSSLLRSGERHTLEAESLAAAMGDQIERWRKKRHWVKIQCMELLFVRGWANKDVADRLDMSEQQVANLKFDFLKLLRAKIKKQRLSADVFPELAVGNDEG